MLPPSTLVLSLPLKAGAVADPSASDMSVTREVTALDWSFIFATLISILKYGLNSPH